MEDTATYTSVPPVDGPAPDPGRVAFVTAATGELSRTRAAGAPPPPADVEGGTLEGSVRRRVGARTGSGGARTSRRRAAAVAAMLAVGTTIAAIALAAFIAQA